MCPQNGIKHNAAITVLNQCLLFLIAALCFIVCCGHINEHGQISFIRKKQKLSPTHDPSLIIVSVLKTQR